MTDFKHGVVYPIEQAPEGVKLMFWGKNGVINISMPRTIREKQQFLWMNHATHFTLWPEPEKPVNIWDKHMDDEGNFITSITEQIVLTGACMRAFPKQSLALAAWIYDYHDPPDGVTVSPENDIHPGAI